MPQGDLGAFHFNYSVHIENLASFLSRKNDEFNKVVAGAYDRHLVIAIMRKRLLTVGRYR